MPENQTRATKASVSEFVDAIVDPTRRADAKTLIKLMRKASGETPKMWGPSIIGFGSYHYKYDSGREGDMPVIAFSPRKPASVLYLMTRLADVAPLLAKLGKHSVSGSCLHIKKLADVDHKILESLIARTVAARREEHSS